MWLKQHVKFPALWRKTKLLYTAFPSSYLVERVSSVAIRILVKNRNPLDVVNRGDSRLTIQVYSRYCEVN